MKRKSIISIIILCLSISLFGCGKAETESVGKCTILIECSTILDNMDKLDEELKPYVPEDGIIVKKTEVEIQDGDSVYDILDRTLKDNNLLMEASFTGSSAYVEGINNFYEFSCGSLSGWMYSVNGEFPNVSCSDKDVKDGDVIEWHYTCDLGADVGDEYTGE